MLFYSLAVTASLDETDSDSHRRRSSCTRILSHPLPLNNLIQSHGRKVHGMVCTVGWEDSNDDDVNPFLNNPLSWIYLILLFHRRVVVVVLWQDEDDEVFLCIVLHEDKKDSHGLLWNAATEPSHHHHHITNSPPCHGVGTLKDTKAQRTSPFGDNEVDKQHWMRTKKYLRFNYNRNGDTYPGNSIAINWISFPIYSATLC